MEENQDKQHPPNYEEHQDILHATHQPLSQESREFINEFIGTEAINTGEQLGFAFYEPNDDYWELVKDQYHFIATTNNRVIFFCLGQAMKEDQSQLAMALKKDGWFKQLKIDFAFLDEFLNGLSSSIQQGSSRWTEYANQGYTGIPAHLSPETFKFGRNILQFIRSIDQKVLIMAVVDNEPRRANFYSKLFKRLEQEGIRNIRLFSPEEWE